MSKIVGIRFIANKDLMEDTVANSGATWVKDQVNNFSENLAILLLAHPDVFELAEVDADADTYIGKRTTAGSIVPVSFVNLNAMDAPQLAAYARLEFNRNVNLEDGRTVDQIRSEVNGYMTNNNLDREASEKVLSSGLMLEKEVTAEEYQAVLDGVLVLKLVAIKPQAQHNAGNNSLPPDATVLDDVLKPAVEVETVAETATNEANYAIEALTLQDLLLSLDKSGLIAFAKQENVTYANSMNVEQLRAKLMRELTPAISTEVGL